VADRLVDRAEQGADSQEILLQSLAMRFERRNLFEVPAANDCGDPLQAEAKLPVEQDLQQQQLRLFVEPVAVGRAVGGFSSPVSS
jgi:hypothetical protein